MPTDLFSIDTVFYYTELFWLECCTLVAYTFLGREDVCCFMNRLSDLTLRFLASAGMRKEPPI